MRQIANFMKHVDVFCVIVVVISLLEFVTVEAGSCWRSINSHGNCEEILMQDVTEQQCCGGQFLNTAWTAEELDGRELFLQQALGRGTPNCKRCIRTCENVVCRRDKVCRMKNGQPRCSCRSDCDAKEYGYTGPICGFDEKTYRDICHLKRRNCRLNKQTEVDYRGRCKHSCDDVDCGRGQYCIVDQNHTPHCIACNLRCRSAQAHEKRCGGDGITYDSMCKLFAASCLQGKSIHAAYKGPCIEGATCATLQCPSSQRCITDSHTGRPRCIQCGFCSPFFDRRTICGSDGVTYPSWCDLRSAMCNKGTTITTKHSGRCRANEVNQDTIEIETRSDINNDYQDDDFDYDYSSNS
ncbi:follistatin-like [Tubulanus polymorphus]|uniref:follistatin-like n=1 Tax=Tubulanus polymorphus TaxID=672921 RepID=UPI003DA40B61